MLRFCSWPFEYLYLDNYKGDIALCPWMQWDHIYIGNIFKQHFHDIWYGEKAEKIRDCIRKGDYSICRLEGCPFLQNKNLPEKSQEYVRTYPTRDTPKIVNLAYDFMCNQYCETCRDKKWKPILPQYKDYMVKIHKQIAPILNKAERITTSGHGDPFASPYMMQVLRKLEPSSNDLQLLIETNGVYCDKKHWDQIYNLHNCHIELVITINSFDRFTYNHISRGGNYDKVIDNLTYAKELRKKKIINKYVLTLVIQDRNFREIPSFITRSFDEYNVDQIMLRPVYQWGTMPENVFWFKDVLNPLHPYHPEYLEILDHPVMQDKRVFNFGGRTLHPARQYPGARECNSVSPELLRLRNENYQLRVEIERLINAATAFAKKTQ